MNKFSFNKKVLCAAVVASLGGLSVGGANAAVSTFASELPVGSTFAVGAWAPSITAYSPTTANPLYLTFTLTNGASWSALTAASLTCSAGLGSAVQTAGHISLAAGGAGTAVATFVVTGVSAGAMLNSCEITNGNVVAGSTISFGETVSAVYGNSLAVATTNSTALTSAASMFSNTTTASTNTALVQTGFITFSTANAVAGSNATTAKIGSFALQLNSSLLSTGQSARGAGPGGMTAMVTAITISLAGTPLAAANQTTGGMYITYDSAAVAAGSATCAGTKLVSATTAAGVNITFSAVSPDPGAGATSGYVYAVCMGVSGAVIPEGTITVGVVGTPNTDPVNANGSAYQISTLIASGTTVGTITHNGASTTVLNLPRAAEAAAGGDSGFLRVYNNSSLAGPVTVTIYSQGATGQTVFTPLVQNCELSSSLDANGALVLPVSSIVSTCGFTEPATGRYRMDVMGAFPTMRAQAFARSANVLTNISADTSSAGN